MEKYKLHYSALNSTKDVEIIEFSSGKKRSQFIADLIIGINPKRVFTLIVKYSNEHSDIYIFEHYQCIEKIVNNMWDEMFLFEWECYEEAYHNAITLKEYSELCYRKSHYLN